MKLIKEHVEDVQVEVIEEETGSGKKSYFIEGVFLQSEIKNRNGRVYPQKILAREINRYNEQFIAKNRAYGELGHPQSPTINLERVSHMIKSIREDGKNYIGKAKIMETPYGKIVKNLIDEGASLGVSSRGVGTLRRIGEADQVQDDFMLATAADIVADPSAPDAFVEGVMEGKEWVYENGILREVDVYGIKRDLDNKGREGLKEAQYKAFTKFMKLLSNS